MENVPQVISKKNLKDFREWQIFLEKLGYSNYFELLNSKNYGIPQNRNRCFMISILGDYYYQFPRKQKLKYRLKDFLEDEVDEKYFLTAEMLKSLIDTTNRNGYVRADRFRPINPLKKDMAYTITSSSCNRVTDNFIIDKTICLNSKVNGKQPSLQNRIYDTEGVSTAITTSYMPSIAEPAVLTPKRNEYGKEIRKKYEAGEIVESRHKMTDLMPRDDGICNTLTSVQKDNYVLVPEATKKGYAEDGGVVVKGNYSPSNHNASRIVDQNGLAPTVMENHGTVTAIAVKKEAGNTSKLRQFYKNIYIDEFNRAFIKVGNMFYRIRKVTPKECWRLMGFSDEDFDKASKVNSNRQLYKQAGNSIVVQVLEAVFKEMM